MSRLYSYGACWRMLTIFATVVLTRQLAVAQPVINSVTPVAGPGKMELMITGHGFSPYGGHNIIHYGATQNYTLYSGTDTLRVVVPYSTSYEPIMVNADAGIAVANVSFDQTFSNGGVPFTAGSFGPPVNYAVDGNGLAVYDLTFDSKPEIISTGGNVAPQFGMRSLSVMTNTSNNGTLSFNTQHFPTARAPYHALPIDLVFTQGSQLITWDSAANGTNEITVYPVTTYPNFALGAGQSFPYGSTAYGQPRKLLTQDLDGDGLLDIVTDQLKQINGNGQFYFTILRNNGTFNNYSFIDSLEFAPATVPGYAPGTLGDYLVQDLDGDGKPDIVATQGGYLYFYRNVSTKGAIAFAPGVSLMSTGGSGNFFRMADIDGDGRLDLVFLDGSSSMAVRLNTGRPGNPSFGGETVIPEGNGPSDLAFGDLDGDGKPDVVVADGQDGDIAAFRNTSTPGRVSFDPAVKYLTTDATYTFASPLKVYITDMDGDQRPEIIVSDGVIKRVTVFQNKLALGAKPVVSTVLPATAAAGQPVGIRGSNFTGALYVSFGGVPASSFTVVSADSILAVPGAGATGNVAVTTRSGSDTLHNAFTWTVPSKPVITAFTPTKGTTGDTVLVTGKYFTTATSLTFGGAAASYFHVINDSAIVSVVGLGRSGTVTVTTLGGVDSLAGFLYKIHTPVITSFTPTSARPGDTVRIFGAQYSGNPAVTQVLFGAYSAPWFQIVNDSMIVAVVGPDGDDGPRSLTLTNNFTAASVNGFTFIRPAPKVRYFYPASGHKGDTVVIKGVNLTGTTKITFGGTPSAKFVVEADSVAMATVGNGVTGDIAVFTPKGIDSAALFTYLGPSDTTKPDTIPTAPPAVFKLLSFNGNMANGHAVLVWVAQHDSSILTYTIQEGSDSTVMTDIGSTPSKRKDTANYAFADPDIRSGKVWYRLILQDTASRRIGGPFVAITSTVTAATGIFPNPAVGMMTALVPNPAVSSQFELADANGRILMIIPVSPGNPSIQVNLSRLNPGTYRLTWSDGQSRVTKTVLILK